MRRDLSEKRILLTGASRGIGRCIAQELAKEGARLTLVARSEDALKELTDSFKAQGVEAISVIGDVTKEEDRARALETAQKHFGGLDVLINNAGVASWGHFSGGTEEILRQVMEVNFFAPAELIRQAIPTLTKGNEPAIVNVASMCGRCGVPAWSEYSASKFALCGLTEALRGEMARFDIDVLLIVPGLTASDLQSNMLRNEGRLQIDFKEKGMPPEQVAREIVRAIQKNKTETTVGKDARWMLRIQKFFPRLFNKLMARRVKKLYAS